MSFVAVATVDELTDDRPIAVEYDDYEIAIVRHDGEVFAIANECSHARVPLSEGDVEDCSIECYLHGSRFDLRTGRPLSLPATAPVPVYPVRISGNDILVDLDHPTSSTTQSQEN